MTLSTCKTIMMSNALYDIDWKLGEEKKKGSTHNDLHIRVRLSHQIHHGRVRVDDSVGRLPLERIIGTEHELHHIGLRRLKPTP